MKKLLFLSLLGAAAFQVQAQVVLNENFNSYVAGNVGTATNGTTPGQGTWYPLQGTVADHQFVTIDAAHGLSYQMISGAGSAAANHRAAVKELTVTTGTAGNDILVGTVDLYTGPATTGSGRLGVQVYDLTYSSTAATGFAGIYYDYATKKLGGYAHLTDATTLMAGFYSINFTTTVTYPENTWIPVSFRYNKSTGQYSWVFPHGTATFTNTNYIPSTNMIPEELNLVNLVGTSAPLNTQINTGAFDNLNLQFTNAAALSTSDVEIPVSVFRIYPNPATDVLNFEYSGKVKGVTIYDMSGKKMKTKADEKSVSISHLLPGAYIVVLSTDEGDLTERFIKK